MPAPTSRHLDRESMASPSRDLRARIPSPTAAASPPSYGASTLSSPTAASTRRCRSTKRIAGTRRLQPRPDEPPYLSHFRVYCPGLTKKFDYLGKPSILHSVDNLALLSIAFACRSKTEYFFYRAGSGCRPSLHHLQEISEYLNRVQFMASVGFIPGGNDGNGDGFVLAALASTLVTGRYELHVFRSQRATWTNNVLSLGARQLTNVDKVMAMGGGKLGFVDLLKGILVCDLLMEEPAYRFIKLPKLLPNNQSEDSSARSFRDISVCTEGL